MLYLSYATYQETQATVHRPGQGSDLQAHWHPREQLHGARRRPHEGHGLHDAVHGRIFQRNNCVLRRRRPLLHELLLRQAARLAVESVYGWNGKLSRRRHPQRKVRSAGGHRQRRHQHKGRRRMEHAGRGTQLQEAEKAI